jgi:hypothetical protein
LISSLLLAQARATAVNKLFFRDDFREDRAQERKQAAPVSREAAGECCICFDMVA